MILEKLTALLKLKLDSANDFKAFVEELKSNKLHLDALDDELFQILTEKEEKAWQVLKLGAFLDPDLSPISIYTDLFDFDGNQLYEATEILKKLSLIKIEEDDEGIEYGISIHRTLQKDAGNSWK